MRTLHETDFWDPTFLPRCLTGAVHHEWLKNVLPEPLQDVVLQTRIHSWFMHDGVLPHFLLAVWEFLDNVFPEQWIGRGGLQHDLILPLGSFPYITISGNIWSLIFMLQKAHDGQNWQQPKQNGFEMIRRLPGIFQRVSHFFRRAISCDEVQGGHFEHLL